MVEGMILYAFVPELTTVYPFNSRTEVKSAKDSPTESFEGVSMVTLPLTCSS